MTKSFVAALFFFPLCVLAQEPDPVPESLPYANAKAFIRGQQDKQAVDISSLLGGFEIMLSDNSYTIKRFRVCWEVDGFTCMSIDGNSIKAEYNNHSLRDAPPGSLLTIDNIIATKDGKDYRVRTFVVRMEDTDETRPTLKNPMICHDKKGRLLCYNDGAYILHFAKKKFTGFITADSTVAYDERNKILSIAADPLNKPAGKVIHIQLEKKAVTFGYDDEHILLDSIQTDNLQLGGLNFEIRRGNASDTIKFTVSRREYSIKVISYTKTWRWELLEKHDAGTFGITYKWKHNNPEHIFIQDNDQRYGTNLTTSFRTGKRIWQLQSEFIELQNKNGRQVITRVPLDPSYHFWYNRFGKLKKKRSQGEIKYCDCN